MSGLRPADETTQSKPPAGAPALSRRVLIVDDKQDVCDSLAILFQSLGAEAHTEPDGPSALAALARFKPDVAISILACPAWTGMSWPAR